MTVIGYQAIGPVKWQPVARIKKLQGHYRDFLPIVFLFALHIKETPSGRLLILLILERMKIWKQVRSI